jgi:Rieske 2Fe-2S family protein
MAHSDTKSSARLGTNLTGSQRPLRQASHVPGYIYSAPEVLEREKEAFFLQDWLYVGRVEELAHPGDYMTWRIAGEPIIIARDTQSTLRGFYNMCLHRGVEVATGQGNQRSFKCPYHGWVYDLTGQLTGAAYMQESVGFDVSQCRLPPLGVDVWAGNIFVTFNPTPPPLAEFITEFAQDFSFLRPQDCRLGNKIRIDLGCNWKLVSENLMDFYHVGVLHANSFGAKFPWDDENVHLKARGGLTIWYKAAPPTPGGEPLFGKMPWLADQPLSFACTGFLAPNLTLFGRIDCVRLMTVWPQTVDTCTFLIYHLFPEEFFARPDFEKNRQIYHDYQIQVLEEDRAMIQSLQQAMGTRGFVPGRMSTLEKPIHNYLNAYLDRVFGANGGATGDRDTV